MPFSTTLTTGITQVDDVISVATNVNARTTYPWRARIDQEIVYVFGGVAEGTAWNVHRGADDTNPATHAAGATVYAAPVGSQAVHLLGPYLVEFNTSGIYVAGFGAKLADLPRGAYVFQMSCHILVRWDVPVVTGDVLLTLTVDNDANTVGKILGSQYIVNSTTAQLYGLSETIPITGDEPNYYYSSTTRANSVWIRGDGLGLRVNVTNLGTPTTGAAYVFALIAEPA